MEFWRGIEDPRSDRIYSSGNRRVKKGPGPRGTRDEEFLVPSLIDMMLCTKNSFSVSALSALGMMSIRDGTRNSSFLDPRGPGRFFTPRFPEE